MNLGRIPAKTASLEPHREALVDVPNGRRITFGDLDERVRRLANALRDILDCPKVTGSQFCRRIAFSTWKSFMVLPGAD